jgi:hypothetical protein
MARIDPNVGSLTDRVEALIKAHNDREPKNNLDSGFLPSAKALLGVWNNVTGINLVKSSMYLEAVAQVQRATIEAVCKWLTTQENEFVGQLDSISEKLREDALRVVKET